MKLKLRKWAGAAAVAGVLTLGVAYAASHREAPITALDHKADITDVFAFVSYGADQKAGEEPKNVTIILCVDPLLEPSNGPTWFPFDPDILYEIKVDNNYDAVADISFQFRFSTDYQLPGVYTAMAGIGENGAKNPRTGDLVVPPKITSFKSLGLNQRQSYSVRMARSFRDIDFVNRSGQPFYAVPANPGPRTIDYPALYKEGTYPLDFGMKVFAGNVDDPFWIDLGAAFDTANFRTLSSGVPAVLTDDEDGAAANKAPDMVAGFNVNAIAIEVPISILLQTGRVEPATSKMATIGIWGTTSRQQETIRRSPPSRTSTSGQWRQVQRMGNPLINELIIGIGSKDRFSMDEPRNDAQFADFFLNPPIVGIVEALYGGALTVPRSPRNDLLPLVTYAPPIAASGTTAGPIADMLRLNTGVPATPPGQMKRLGAIVGDLGGFPNGRRLQDDVTDIVLRVGVGGVLTGAALNKSPNNRLGDGVNSNDVEYRMEFPYLGYAHSGRDHVHDNPGSGNATPANPQPTN